MNNMTSRLFPACAIGLTLAFGAPLALADHHGDSHTGTHMEGETTPQQQRDEQMRRDGDASTETPSDMRPGQGDTDPAGTDATRHVPGAPDKGTNPATEPGTDY